MLDKHFFTVRVAGGVLLALIALWALWFFLSRLDDGGETPVAHVEEGQTLRETEEPEGFPHQGQEPPVDVMGHETPQEEPRSEFAVEGAHKAAEKAFPGGLHEAPEMTTMHEEKAPGVAFVEATIAALDFELNERFWGWRTNDIIQLTDNVENIQRGVLEVVRRTSVTLAERIARYGPTDVLDKNLENAMNWIMIKPDQYWLPSAEDSYNDAVKQLRKYAERIEKGEARFYTRADNLIPLLVSFTDLLGSCDDNLVKSKEKDGSDVSWFQVDDYFYYAKGVATAMGKILHAVEIDFAGALEARGSLDLLEHAIHACHTASELDPWFLVTDAPLDGIIANHRANMAAPISHARHYLDVLAETLST